MGCSSAEKRLMLRSALYKRSNTMHNTQLNAKLRPLYMQMAMTLRMAGYARIICLLRIVPF